MRIENNISSSLGWEEEISGLSRGAGGFGEYLNQALQKGKQVAG